MWRRGDEPVVGWTPPPPSDVEPPPYLLSLQPCFVIKFIYSRPASVVEPEEHLLVGIAAFSLPFPPRLSFVTPPPLSAPLQRTFG